MKKDEQNIKIVTFSVSCRLLSILAGVSLYLFAIQRRLRRYQF